MATDIQENVSEVASRTAPQQPLQSAKPPMARLVLNILAILCIALFAWLAVENASQTTTVLLFGQIYTVPVALVMVLGGLLLAVAAVLRLSSTLQAVGKDAKFSQRKIERLEVTAETASERVKSLEQKVQTLEAALKRALNK